MRLSVMRPMRAVTEVVSSQVATSRLMRSETRSSRTAPPRSASARTTSRSLMMPARGFSRLVTTSAPTPRSLSSATASLIVRSWEMVATSRPLVDSRFATCTATSSGPANTSPHLDPMPRSHEPQRSQTRGGELLEFVVSVEGLDGAHSARTAPYDDGLGGGAEVVESHAAKEVTVGDGRGREEAVVPGHQVVGVQDAGEVVAQGFGGPAFLVVARVQDALDLAAQSLHRRGRDHALGRATDAQEDVDAGVGPGGRDRSGHVTVGDRHEPGPGLADLGDEVVVTRAIEDHHAELLDRSVELL